MPATRRATVVLPVPGLPLKIMCRVIVGALRPASARRPSTRSTAAWRWISAFTSVRPDEAVELGEQLLDRLRLGLGLGRLGGRRGLGRRRRGRHRLGLVGTGPVEVGDPLLDAAELVHELAEQVIADVRDRLACRGTFAELGGGRGGGVADRAGVRLAERAGGQRDVGQRPGVRRRVGRAGQRERAHASASGRSGSDAPGRRRP